MLKRWPIGEVVSLKDEELSILLALNAIRQFKGHLINDLKCKSISLLDLAASPSVIREFTRSESVIQRWYEMLSKGWHFRELERCRAEGIEILVWGEEGYPSSLDRLSDPPLLLYWWGNSPKSYKAAVALVGTRRCSNYGGRVAFELAFKMAEEGFPIVSGGAYGIDARAHRGALEAGGVSLSVFGTGVDVFYPAKNETLFEGLKEKGALISEYPLGTKGMPWNFPERNRIIVGLAEVVVVVEAPIKSGAMITGRIAMECGVELWAVPGRINEGVARGSNLLIFDGAYPLIDVDSFVHLMKGSPEGFLVKGQSEVSLAELDDGERRVYGLLREKGDRTVDNISLECKMTPAQVFTTLTKLESRGLASATGPGRWGANAFMEGEKGVG